MEKGSLQQWGSPQSRSPPHHPPPRAKQGCQRTERSWLWPCTPPPAMTVKGWDSKAFQPGLSGQQQAWTQHCLQGARGATAPSRATWDPGTHRGSRGCGHTAQIVHKVPPPQAQAIRTESPPIHPAFASGQGPYQACGSEQDKAGALSGPFQEWAR